MKIYQKISNYAFFFSLFIIFLAIISGIIDFFTTGGFGLIIASNRTGWLILIGGILLILALINYLIFWIIKSIKK